MWTVHRKSMDVPDCLGQTQTRDLIERKVLCPMNDRLSVEQRWARLNRPAPKYLGGSMNRIIRIHSHAKCVRAALEDDFHHFRVSIDHDGTTLHSASSVSLRAPYSLCGDAGGRLQALIGLPITNDITALTKQTDARSQCTHQFDLACLAVAMAARGLGTRTYHAIVHDSRDSRYLATLDRDGTRVLSWSMDRETIVDPHPYAGRSIGGGFTAFVSQQLAGDEAEAALVLRRSVFITSGRGIADWTDSFDYAMVTGGCWVQQPERHQMALRNRGSNIDFTGRVDRLLAEEDDWLTRPDSR